MLYIDIEGSNVKNALTKGLKKLSLKKEDVKTEILTKEKKGLFGIGNRQLAKIRIFYKEKNEINNILDNIKTIISYIDNEALISIDNEKGRYYLKINSKIPEQFIGKGGKTQNALQMLIDTLLQKYNNSFKIIVDVNNYLDRKNNNFKNWINDQIKLVLEKKKPIVLKPMNSFQRRIIHLEVKKYPKLKSQSNGISKLKSIKISLSNYNSSANNFSPNLNKKESDEGRGGIKEEKKFNSNHEAQDKTNNPKN